MGHVIISNKYLFLSYNIDLALTNSTDPDECRMVCDFVWVFTVSQSTRLGVSGLKLGLIIK